VCESSMMEVDYVPKSVPSVGKIRMRTRRERINAIELGSSCSGCRHAAGRQCAGQPRLRDLWPSRSVGGIAPWTENRVLSRAMVLGKRHAMTAASVRGAMPLQVAVEY
jgi:hypothetical protein